MPAMNTRMGMSRRASGGGDTTPPDALTVLQWDVVNLPSSTGDTATLTISESPNDGGAPITAFQYAVDGGDPITLSGGGVIGSWVIVLPPTTEVDITVYSVNAVGVSLVSDVKTVTPTIAGVPPTVTLIDVSETGIELEVSKPSTMFMARNTSTTPLSGAATEAAAEETWPDMVVGANPLSIDDSAWAPDDYQLHFVAKDDDLNITPFSTVVPWTKEAPPVTEYSHVLNPAAASSGLRYDFTANTIFNITTSKSAGYWLGAYAYFDGTNWTGDIISVANSASLSGFMQVSGNLAGWRQQGGSLGTTTALATPGASGWYFVTAHFLIKEAGDASPRLVINFWRNGTLATPLSSATAEPAGITALNRFGFGHRADNTPSDYNNFEYCGMCWGTGNPSLMHDWVYNAGTLRDVRDYNFAGDANGCTLEGFWPAGRNSGATFDVADTQLDDTVGALDTPTLVGTMEWAALTGPIGD